MKKNPPPALPKKQSSISVYEAVYTYEASKKDELSFEEGDLLYVLDKKSAGWWKAKCGDKIGLIPSNYVQESDMELESPLHDAAKRGNMELLKECLSLEIDINKKDKSGSTALHWSAIGGQLECMEMLLKYKNIIVNTKNNLGDSPLHNAAWKGYDKCVKLLLEHGADKNALNNENKKPLQLTKDPYCMALLKETTMSAEGYDLSTDDENDD